MEVVTFNVVGVSVVAIGIFLDRILVRRHKVWLHNALVGAWLKISDTPFPDLAPRIVSRIMVPLCRPINGRHLPGTLFKLVLISWFFTSLASAIGAFMDGIADSNPYSWLPIFPVYFVNGFFDALTLLITYYILRLAVKRGSWLLVGLVAVNAVIAATIAIVSLPFLAWAHNEAYLRNWPGSGDAIRRLVSSSGQLYSLMEDSLSPEIEKHLRENGPIPFEIERANWSGLGFTAQHLKATYTFLPGTTAESYRNHTDAMKRYARSLYDEGSITFFFTPKYPFWKSYLLSIRQLRDDVWNWTSNLDGSYVAKGETWTMSANEAAIVCGRWCFILVSATTLIPTVVLASALAFLAALKLVRQIVAGVTLYFIEKTTEADPRLSPEKFFPFTLLSVVLGLFLHVTREFASWIANLLIP